jgi:hypothetical protein
MILNYTKIYFIFGLLMLFVSKYLIGLTSYEFYNNVFSFMLECIGTVLLIPFLVSIKSGHGFFYKLITFISIISYSMYLLNDAVIQGLILPGAFKIFGIFDSQTTFFC